MSALARYFHRRGDTVSGYDRTPSPLTAELEAEGIDVHYDDAPDRLPTISTWWFIPLPSRKSWVSSKRSGNVACASRNVRRCWAS